MEVWEAASHQDGLIPSVTSSSPDLSSLSLNAGGPWTLPRGARRGCHLWRGQTGWNPWPRPRCGEEMWGGEVQKAGARLIDIARAMVWNFRFEERLLFPQAILAFSRSEAAKRAPGLQHPQLCIDAIQYGIENGGEAGLVKVRKGGRVRACQGVGFESLTFISPRCRRVSALPRPPAWTRTRPLSTSSLLRGPPRRSRASQMQVCGGGGECG